MATSFPSGLDSFTNPTAVDTLDSPPHDTQHANANDAIEALQAKVGVDGSAVTTSLDYKVANLESRPVETKTASYTLVATDVNKRIVMNSASATTITVDDGVFSAGDTLWIHNIGAGTTTVTAGTATVDTAGSLDVGQWEGGSLHFTSASSAIFFRGGGAVSSANFTDTETGTYSSGGKNYKYLTFNSSGTITIDTAGLADILVVGGGGSGAQGRGGGGGAGGHLYVTGAYLPVGTLTVTVGAGGPAVPSAFVTSAANSGISGNASSIADYISPGGGGGGCMNYNGTDYYNSAGDNGGSGGGGSGGTVAGRSLSGGTGFALVGNDGGDGTTSEGAGGGGGAGAAGSNGSGTTGGAGGAGISNSITGSAVDRAGGGGGAGNPSGAGGSGGGGAGSYLGSGTAGTANSGGGGGGTVVFGSTRLTGAGGSGVVIVRVEV